MISRRDAVERISLMLGGTLSAQMTAGVMGQVLNEGPGVEATEAQAALLAELAEVIIPTTDTPGAKAAGVEQFIIRVLRDCYELEQQESFYTELAKIDQTSQSAHGANFVDLPPEQKVAVVEDAIQSNKAFFNAMKKFTIVGYFTSEIGATQALEYLPVPGKFEGDVPMKEGQKAWAVSRKGFAWSAPKI
jgi:hypothetical protein